jgi:hypothetical protein
MSHLIRLAKCRVAPAMVVLSMREPADLWEIPRSLQADKIDRIVREVG